LDWEIGQNLPTSEDLSTMNAMAIEERYQCVVWLYKIRKQYSRMGLFQPDFICIIFGRMLPNKATRDDSDIKIAVNAWCDNSIRAEAEEKYGHISKWNTSRVTTMKELFLLDYVVNNFNDDISKWDVSNVTSMESMFSQCCKFNGDLSKWDVGNVTSMEKMFAQCGKFNCDISKWDVSKVTSMGWMFSSCRSFNCDISKWDVINVRNMEWMFPHCRRFNSDLSNVFLAHTSLKGLTRVLQQQHEQHHEKTYL
jgi:surface protein